ncbi:MAG: hypothetical protein K5924_05325 [Chloroflexi bacterium]|nr:hypothetical protein [Chloroflexota bacterium]
MTSGLDPAWIAAQRWFRSKQRPVAGVAEIDAAELGDARLRVLEVSYADGGERHQYLVPTVGDGEPNDGDGAWRAVARAIVSGSELQSRRGRFSGRATSALEELLPSPLEAVDALDERRLSVEQSNTSIVLGGRLILKLYRLLEAGHNPDLEVSAFLTEAGFADTPPVAGGLTYQADDGERASAAMLQAFVPSVGDAWAAMLSSLSADPPRATDLAARVGSVTAALHRTLASRPDHPGFPARPATVDETSSWRASAERQLAQAVTAVGGASHDRLVQLAPAVTARFADTFGAATGEATVTRIHGDYHLGQLLARADGGLSIIDFEGEPARPLAERREPGSPLRDVAGLLRSLDYAARTAERADPAFAAEPWLADARAAFLSAYGELDDDERALLAAFELEKACYEVRYEANNRVDWLWLPLAAVERLVA